MELSVELSVELSIEQSLQQSVQLYTFTFLFYHHVMSFHSQKPFESEEGERRNGRADREAAFLETLFSSF